MKQKINEQAPVIERQQGLIHAPVTVVWKVLTDIERWPAWQQNVKSAKIYGSVAENTKFVWKAAGLTFHSQLHTVEPYEAFGWTGKIMGAFAIHNWKLEDQGDKTRIYVEESMEGFFPSLMKKSFQKQLISGMDKNLSELKQESERKKVSG